VRHGKVNPGKVLMTIAIRCPGCGQSRAADEASVGQIVQCNQCGRSFTAIMSSDGTITPMPGGQSAGPPMRLNPEANPSTEPLSLQTIGRYTVCRKLGAGAMGVVWLAHDPNLDRDVAIKVLAVQTRDADFLKRFLREARLAAKLHHPNTVTVHDVGAEGDQAYM